MDNYNPLEQINNATEFIKRHHDKVKDEATKERFVNAIKNLEAANKETADNEEKIAILADAATQWANSLLFSLIQEEPITKFVDDDFRELAPAIEVLKIRNTFMDKRQAEIDAVNEEQNRIAKAQKGIDIFTAIISGMSKDEAKAKMAEYEEKLAQAQQQVQR